MMNEVSGNIQLPALEEDDEGTLDEPVLTTLKRDGKAIVKKCFHVLVPYRADKSLLHDWDLWGPLILCIMMAVLLHSKDDSGDHTVHFLHVFLLVWGGAAVVTVNAQLLRGKVSFFQSVCTLGYCLVPLTISLIVSRILLIFAGTTFKLMFIIKVVIVSASLVWSVWASLGFLSNYLPADRKALAIYPIVLFYFSISLLILSQHNAF
ncbi:hypothetical protein EMCRGX_G005865 [Ephydatia muelleri]